MKRDQKKLTLAPTTLRPLRPLRDDEAKLVAGGISHAGACYGASLVAC